MQRRKLCAHPGSRACFLPAPQKTAKWREPDAKQGVRVLDGMGWGRAIFSRGEEVINQSSSLLSTWNIPGTMTKTLCAIPYLILKTAPGRWLAVSQGRKQTQEVKPPAKYHQAQCRVSGSGVSDPIAFQLD